MQKVNFDGTAELIFFSFLSRVVIYRLSLLSWII